MSIPETVKTLESYSGSSFCPEDFTAFWKEQNQNAAQPRPVVWNRVPFHNPMADYWELTFPATDGKLLTARFLRPKQGTPAPVVLMFHDNARRTRGWHHMTRFIALGYAVLALENREGCYSLTKGWAVTHTALYRRTHCRPSRRDTPGDRQHADAGMGRRAWRRAGNRDRRNAPGSGRKVCRSASNARRFL